MIFFLIENILDFFILDHYRLDGNRLGWLLEIGGKVVLNRVDTLNVSQCI